MSRPEEATAAVPWTHKLTCWDDNHGIRTDDEVRVEVPHNDEHHIVHVIEGRVTHTDHAEIYVEGREILDVATPS